ncbi:MAG TPA: hypothetical protein VGE02_06505 [Gemmatimonadales bacterium]
MSNRDWEKELAMIDRQLSSLSDEELAAQKDAASPQGAPPAARAAAPAGRPSTASAASPGVAPVAPVAPAPGTGWRARLAVNGKLLLALAAGVGIVFWPWGWRCGSDLVVFMAAVAGVTLSGIWAARSTWYHRAGKRHVLALLVVLWGLTLTAWQILPRAGLVVPNYMNVPAVWGCG